MQTNHVRRPSDHVRPRIALARRLICLASGRPSEADRLIRKALAGLIELSDIKDPDTMTLCFFGLVVASLKEAEFRNEPIKMLGALPLTSEGAAVALLTLDFSWRLAYVLGCVLNFSSEEAAFITSVAPKEHERRLFQAEQCLEELF